MFVDKPWLRFLEGDSGGTGSSSQSGDPTPGGTGGENGNADDDGDDSGEIDWKAKFEAERSNSRKWENRAKDNKKAADKLAELEEADKTEAQKAADRAAKAEQERDAALVDGLRWKIASRYGISDDVADLMLTGTDEDTLTAQAEMWKSNSPDDSSSEPSGRPTPRPNANRKTRPDIGSVSAGRTRWEERHNKNTP